MTGGPCHAGRGRPESCSRRASSTPASDSTLLSRGHPALPAPPGEGPAEGPPASPEPSPGPRWGGPDGRWPFPLEVQPPHNTTDHSMHLSEQEAVFLLRMKFYRIYLPSARTDAGPPRALLLTQTGSSSTGGSRGSFPHRVPGPFQLGMPGPEPGNFCVASRDSSHSAAAALSV